LVKKIDIRKSNITLLQNINESKEIEKQKNTNRNKLLDDLKTNILKGTGYDRINRKAIQGNLDNFNSNEKTVTSITDDVPKKVEDAEDLGSLIEQKRILDEKINSMKTNNQSYPHVEKASENKSDEDTFMKSIVDPIIKDNTKSKNT
jgi:hypothetical protein